MKIKNVYKNLLLSGCAAMLTGVTSCDDFLTLYPTSQIVEEQFWEDKTDLMSAVGGCYYQMVQSSMVERYFVWGEARSDNFELKSEDWTIMKDLMNANLLETSSFFDWSPFYTCINYCNKVLQHGPDIVERDPAFTESDWGPLKAEMLGIRSLCYFYLLRSYGDVPYVTQSVSTDEEAKAQKVAQTPVAEILDNIITDLDSVKDDAMIEMETNTFTKGRMTRKALYTLLADVSLWRAAMNASYKDSAEAQAMSKADYERVITCCDYVINEMIREKKENGGISGGISIGGSTGSSPYPLIMNPSGSMFTSRSYQEIFGIGNSSESIFELQFDGSSNVNTTFVGTQDAAGYFGRGGGLLFSPGKLYVSTIFQSPEETQDPTAHVFSKTDIRQWETVQYQGSGQKEFPFIKYCPTTVTHEVDETQAARGFLKEADYMGMRGLSCDANWIFYRLSDVMLMKAEAISQLYPEDTEKLAEGFGLVNAIYERSNPTLPDADKLVATNYATGATLYAFVMRERQREFVGEGKRWFDLVRMALRDGRTRDMLTLLLKKYSANQSAVNAKLTPMAALYSPVYREERKVNPNLKQNEAWAKDETIERN